VSQHEEDAMRYAAGKLGLAVVVGAVVGAAWISAQPARAVVDAAWISAQPAQPTSRNTGDSRGMVLMVQWSHRDLNRDFYEYKRSFDVQGVTEEMLRCYKQCYEEGYHLDKVIQRDVFRKCVRKHEIHPDGCKTW
jgi:hypothetical protein